MTRMGRKNSVTSAGLQWIAYLTMLIDHFFAVVYYPLLNRPGVTDGMWCLYRAGRAVGRISFVLFAFMIAEGFHYTRDRKRYCLRIAALAVISEVPFDLAFAQTVWNPESQNIFFTLLLGILALCLIERWKEKPWLQFLAAAVACAAAWLLRTDYKFMGVILIIMFAVCRGNSGRQAVLGGLILYGGTFAMYVAEYIGYGYSVWDLAASALRELYGMAAFVILHHYHGEKGKRLPKWICYTFYPMHLLLLCLLKSICGW